jgi:uncharacterized protein (DUF342 family)
MHGRLEKNMDQNETPEVIQTTAPITLIEVTASDDGMTGFIKLTKQGENPPPVTKEQFMTALHDNRIVYGIKETSVEKLAARPIYNIKIEIAKGLAPVLGQDGFITFYVKRDAEYRPEINMEGTIDYKNLDYFQIVKKDQVLAEITKETEGTEGMNIFGGVVPTKNGRVPNTPVGKNTHLIQDDTLLVADCDGVIRFSRDIVDVADMLKINGNVDNLTGNINFTGDVNIEGDVSDGFSVKSGGNIIVKGVVENAAIEAAGNVHISKGINGGGTNSIYVGGNLKCKYIEHANIHVEGDISADYIIDSYVTCMGNIELAGGKELVVGGEVKVLGELRAKDIGSERVRNTKIEVLGVKIMDTETIEKLTKERDELNARVQLLAENAQKLNQSRMNASDEVMEQLAMAKKQILIIRDKVDQLNFQIQQLEKNWTMDFHGAILCKRKIYQGVKINFGEEKFSFTLDNIEHCKIFFADGKIIQGTL